MAEAKYSDLLIGGNPWEPLPWALKTESLRPHVDFLVSTQDRIALLAHMPALLSYFSGRDRRMEANALASVSGINQVKVNELGRLPLTNAHVAHINAQIVDLNALDTDELRVLLFQQGIPYVQSVMKKNPQINRSIEAVYSAIIFEAWICFESMASDLWVTAVDKGPKFLANTAANSKELKTPDRQITPKLLHALKYDARKELGLFLRETHRVSFQRLSDIRATYKIVFGEPIWDLFSDVNDGYIFALSAFRNIFAHRAGKADDEFVEQVKRFPEFRTIEDGDQINLDAATARKLWHASAHMGLALLKFVDDYIHEQSK